MTSIPQQREVVGDKSAARSSGATALARPSRRSRPSNCRGATKGGADTAQGAAAADEVKKVLEVVRALGRQGRATESLRRRSPNDDKVRQCGGLMRERRPQARSLNLKGRAEAPPKSSSIHPGTTATGLALCVFRPRCALQHYDRARSFVYDASQAPGGKGGPVHKTRGR